jgi:hypothetical protein
MTTVRITKLERHEDGFYTANVTAAGLDTVRVDNSIGPWTLPRDPAMPANARCVRREVLPWAVVLLNKRVRAFERGEAHDDAEDHHAPAREQALKRPRSIDRGPRAPEPSAADVIATTMAKAGADAVRRAA